MIKFVLLIFTILFLVLLFLGSILGKIIRLFMPRRTTQNRTEQGGSHSPEPEKEQKVFSDDVGEYVQYEEIKEE